MVEEIVVRDEFSPCAAGGREWGPHKEIDLCVPMVFPQRWG